jgi:hypothetical protein
VWTEGATFCDFSTSLQILAVLERISVVPVKALRQQQEQREQWVVAEMRRAMEEQTVISHLAKKSWWQRLSGGGK